MCVPADKAANNVIIVCKKYYLEVVANEITATTTYEPVIDNKEDIIIEHLLYIRNKSIVIKHELHCLPSFYWLPELHKQPYGSRFIVTSYKWTTKPLSKILTICLNTMAPPVKVKNLGISKIMRFTFFLWQILTSV